ncbi:uncharacterized protein LOC116378901 [Anarrhichthys ocellatus]|uniref:uncharacterized protein LOC116378901 n=1 Tax=Anarrhichthys ocellatus TaxID=433405 RepID=UPI0012ECE2F3|nr:uncharacterized protein LOC116378901 [Anarrhichthys ocellatus]
MCRVKLLMERLFTLLFIVFVHNHSSRMLLLLCSFPQVIISLLLLRAACWTDWFDRDDPSGTGDWEILASLRIANPGKICLTPVDIEVQTLTGLSMNVTGDVIYKSDTTGFACRNRDQRGKICNDYRVRLSCPLSFCEEKACWTDWFDRDDPSGSGDWEILAGLRKANPGKICLTPVDIEVQTLTGLTVAQTGDVIYRNDTTTGFICRNRDQWRGRHCNDYRVRFSCHPPFCGVQVSHQSSSLFHCSVQRARQTGLT